MPTAVIQPSFANGEFSPTLYGRVDLQKYHSAAAMLRNFIVDYRGGVSNRPGTAFVGQVKQAAPNQNNPPRIIPFQFSTIQAYALEFGDQYIRVIKNGAYVTEATINVSGVTQANPGVITTGAHGLSTGDWVYISGLGGMTQLNGRTVKITVLSATTFSIQDTLTGNNINTSGYSAYTSGGTVGRIYTLSTPYALADLYSLKYTQSADVMTLTHPSYAPRELTRTGDASWTLSTITFAAQLSPPGGILVTSSSAGTVLYAYRVTAITEDGNESIASDAFTIESADINSTSNHVIVAWAPVAGAKFYNVYKSTPIKGSVGGAGVTTWPIPTLFGFMITTEALRVADTNINPDYAQTPPLARNPLAPGQVTAVSVTAGGTGYTSTPTVSFSGGGGSGAVAQALLNGGVVVGFVIINSGQNYTSAPTVTISGGGGSGATAVATIGPISGNYPGVCAYFQQRRVFGASINNPQSFWMTQPGLHYNFNISQPSKPDDAITGTLASVQVNAIKHLLPMPGGLIALTSYGAWQIQGAGGEAITPANASAQAQAYNGVSDLLPLVINYDILYVTARGNIVKDFEYNFQTNIYSGRDITTLSSHLFSGYQIVSWAFAETPNKLAWAIRDDGTLLTLAFLKEQEVLGWSHSDTFGRFLSVCSIPEGDEDAVYVIVERNIAGQYTYYTERFASRNILGDIQNSWFLDSALTTGGSTLSSIITMGDYTVGNNRSWVLGSAVLNSGHIGHQIRSGSGIALITNVVGTTVTVNILTEFPSFPNSTRGQVLFEGDWTLWPPITSVSGLWHLEGETIGLFGDGTYIGTAVVTNGAVSLGGTYFRVVAGLKYTAQFQTLALDTGNPTIAGKRKQAFGVTTRVAYSYGFKIGPTFSNLITWNPNVENFAGTTALGLRTGDYRRNVNQGWVEPGQLCIQQDDPYPVTILAVVPELHVGDSPERRRQS